MADKKEKKKRYELGKIATQTETVIIDTETDKEYSLTEFLAKLGNDIAEIKQSTV